MDCQEARRLIATAGARSMDRLSPSLAEHVEHCAACAQAWQTERDLERLLSTAAPEVSIGAAQHGRLDAAIRAASARRRAPLPGWAPAAGALVAAGAVVAVAVGQLPSLLGPSADAGGVATPAVVQVPPAGDPQPSIPASEASERPVAPETDTERERPTKGENSAPTAAPVFARPAVRASKPARRPAQPPSAAAFEAPREAVAEPAMDVVTSLAARTPALRRAATDEASEAVAVASAEDLDALHAVPVFGGAAVAVVTTLEAEPGAGFGEYAPCAEETDVVVSFGDVVSAGWASDVPAAALVEPAGARLTADSERWEAPTPTPADSSEVVIPR